MNSPHASPAAVAERVARRLRCVTRSWIRSGFAPSAIVSAMNVDLVAWARDSSWRAPKARSPPPHVACRSAAVGYLAGRGSELRDGHSRSLGWPVSPGAAAIPPPGDVRARSRRQERPVTRRVTALGSEDPRRCRSRPRSSTEPRDPRGSSRPYPILRLPPPPLSFDNSVSSASVATRRLSGSLRTSARRVPRAAPQGHQDGGLVRGTRQVLARHRAAGPLWGRRDVARGGARLGRKPIHGVRRATPPRSRSQGAERYIDDLAATPKLLENVIFRSRAASGREMRDALPARGRDQRSSACVGPCPDRHRRHGRRQPRGDLHCARTDRQCSDGAGDPCNRATVGDHPLSEPRRTVSSCATR